MAATKHGCGMLSPIYWEASATTSEAVTAIVNSVAPTDGKGIKTMVALLGWQI